MEGFISRVILLLFGLILVLGAGNAHAKTRAYKFEIKLKKVSRLCHSKYIVTANGQYPGPTIYAREGDTVLVNVTNHVKYNVSIHWHGIRQLRTGWADGPAYITQCPIQTGQSYVYNFTITGQRGTLFWHAHILWLRATLHGALIILPKKGVPYPFPAPYQEQVLVLGEWWNSDTEKVINDAMKTGGAPNVSDAHTINGKPGSLPELSALSDGSICKDAKHTFALSVKPNKTYMFRIVNAALNDEVFFDVAGHHLTVVEVDATYTKPFVTKSLLIAPGQTSNVLLRTDKDATKRYFITVRSFMDAPITVDNKTTTAILQYEGLPSKLAVSNPELPIIPAVNDSALAANLSTSLRSLNSEEYPARVPNSVDKRLIFTVGLGLLPCPKCQGGMRTAASMNNVSFIMPKESSLLEAHFFNISGVFTTDFPEKPPTIFNYTAQPSQNISMVASTGTRVTRLAFNETVELIFQGTTFLAAESHPIHLHGFNFFVVGRGVGNFDAAKDPAKYNLKDPVERNTVGVPAGGWTAIRFRADNPGVWFMHCHLEIHTTWGLKTAFVVDNGPSPQTSILPPPKDLPKC